MENQNSTCHLTPMRPSDSVLNQVKNTLSELLSGAAAEDDAPVSQPDLSNGSTKSGFNRSREGFTERVKTFTLSRWCGKPLKLSPPLLAQYGWECIGEDVIKCCSCAAIVSVRLPWSNSTNYHEECTKSVKKIISGHMKICSWQSNGCPDFYVNPLSLQYLTIEARSKLVDDFANRVDHLVLLRSSLPFVGPNVLHKMNLSAEAVGKLLKLANLCEVVYEGGLDEDTSNAIKLSSLVLALCGWNTSNTSDSPNPTIFCEETGRKVGLWNFHSIKQQIHCDEGQESGDCPPAKKPKTDDDQKTLAIQRDFFDPIEQHHVWSPWIVYLTPLDTSLTETAEDQYQPSKDEQAGWIILRDVILGSETADKENLLETSIDSEVTEVSASPKLKAKTPPRVAVQHARKIFSEWSSPQ